MRPRRQAEEHTSFQDVPAFNPKLDIKTDVAMVYGLRADLSERVTSWEKAGYIPHVMTGVSWGDYQDYVRGEWDGEQHYDDAQAATGGFKLEHGINQGHDVYYMVPTKPYTAYLAEKLKAVVDSGARAIHLEEPEFWVRGGYAESFKREWQDFYGEPWQEPESSPDARYRTSRLMQYLYTRAIDTLCRELKAYANEKGIRDFRCYVPTHSLVNYAHWRIVSPEAALLHIPDCDGIIAQVWTGTSRTATVYQNRLKERTFEAAYCEYGSSVAMMRGTGKHLWLLADPIEDDPNFSWADYRYNWECTVAASLLFPENARFEVVPWPRRVFLGTYPKLDNIKEQPLYPIVESYVARLKDENSKVDLREAVDYFEQYARAQGVSSETLGFSSQPRKIEGEIRFGDVLAYIFSFYKHLNETLEQSKAERLRDAIGKFYLDPTEERIGIPSTYATELQVVFNALADMDWKQEEIVWMNSQPGVGLCLSDTLMFQRGDPDPSDKDMSSLYGLSLPLIKHGLPLQIVQLEMLRGSLVGMRVLLLTYEGMKPATEQTHTLLVEWVNQGGILILFGDGDSYNSVRSWWNQEGNDYPSPQAHLYKQLAIPELPGTYPCGSGAVIIASESPTALAHDPEGANVVRAYVHRALNHLKLTWTEQNSFVLYRGPYVIAVGMDESNIETNTVLHGNFVNLFDSQLEILTDVEIVPNSRWLLYDVNRVKEQAWVIAASGLVSDESVKDHQITFNLSGAEGTTAVARVLLPEAPQSVSVPDSQWDAASKTLFLSCPAVSQGVSISIGW